MILLPGMMTDEDDILITYYWPTFKLNTYYWPTCISDTMQCTVYVKSFKYEREVSI